MTNEDAIRWLDNLKNDIGNPHYERLWPYAQAIDEIIALLEGQEAVKPKSKTRHGSTTMVQHWCGNCMVMLHGKPKYCSNCGRKVKWE